MLTIFDSAAPVKSDRPFGPAVDDMDDAAMFDEADPDWDSIAAQRAWEDAYEAGRLAPPEIDRCLLCGATSDDLTFQGLCDPCDDRATDASTTCQNYAAGLGFQVF